MLYSEIFQTIYVSIILLFEDLKQNNWVLLHSEILRYNKNGNPFML